MSKKTRGITLKSLTKADEGMQELINPVPISMVDDIDISEDGTELDDLIASENQAVRDVIDMLEDTAALLTEKASGSHR